MSVKWGFVMKWMDAVIWASIIFDSLHSKPKVYAQQKYGMREVFGIKPWKNLI